MRIYLATGNAGKVRDFRALGLAIEMLPGFSSLPTAEETGGSFAENARIKALYYGRLTQEAVLADDSGLEVEALGGAPGVYSARYAGPHGDEAANSRLLLERLQGLGEGQRRARFVCALALTRQGVVLGEFGGTAEGRILEMARGGEGFGYDPLFYSAEAGAGFGELSAEQKGRYSHRGAAVRALIEWIGSDEAQIA
ncbi:MAG: RdgB/HAM1 family non-canonical purine NTP pyrophosphatase [Terriglobales bacterium]